MLEVIMQSFFIHLFHGFVAVGIGWVGLAWLDRRLASGTTAFAQHFAAMQADPRALGTYFGMRFIGLCVLAGCFILG